MEFGLGSELSNWVLEMWKRQRAVPFVFEAVQPIDVADWINITALSGATRCVEEQAGSCAATEDSGREEHGAAPVDELDERHHFMTSQSVLRIACNGDEMSPRIQSSPQCADPAESLAEMTIKQPKDRYQPRERKTFLEPSTSRPERTRSLDQADADVYVGSSDAISAISESSSNIPDVLSDFFDIARVVNLKLEHLSELDPMGDASKTASLQDALLVAKERMAEQRDKCLACGIDPELFRYRRRSSASA